MFYFRFLSPDHFYSLFSSNKFDAKKKKRKEKGILNDIFTKETHARKTSKAVSDTGLGFSFDSLINPIRIHKNSGDAFTRHRNESLSAIISRNPYIDRGGWWKNFLTNDTLRVTPHRVSLFFSIRIIPASRTLKRYSRVSRKRKRTRKQPGMEDPWEIKPWFLNVLSVAERKRAKGGKEMTMIFSFFFLV